MVNMIGPCSDAVEKDGNVPTGMMQSESGILSASFPRGCAAPQTAKTS